MPKLISFTSLSPLRKSVALSWFTIRMWAAFKMENLSSQHQQMRLVRKEIVNSSEETAKELMQTFLLGKGQYMCEQFIPVKLDKGTWLCFPWSFRKPASLCIPFWCLKSWKELSKAHSVLPVDWINSKHEYNCFSGLLRLIKIIATFTWLRMFYYWLQIVFRSLTSLASWSSTDQGNQRREFLNIWGIRNCFNNQIKKICDSYPYKMAQTAKPGENVTVSSR